MNTPSINDLKTAWSHRDFSTNPVSRAAIHLIADGKSATPRALAEATGMSIEDINAHIDSVSRAGVDVEDGSIVGLAVTPRVTRHRFRVRGNDLYTWCGFDALFVPIILGDRAEVVSTCPVTGTEIRLTVEPDGTVSSATPGSVVVGIVSAQVLSCTIAGPGGTCAQMPFFASPEAGRRWLDNHPGVAVVDLDQARDVARSYVVKCGNHATSGGGAAKMRAIGQDVLGGPDVLHEIVVDRPTPGPSELLVRVRAAGLNPTDWKHRANGRFESPLGDPPFILGWDVSGVVDAVGFGVTLFAPGDEVFGMLPYPYGVGAFAQYATAPARSFARKPSNIDHVHAGAMPVAALTAWQALVDTANVRAGQRVLIHAAAGGVGHLGVQIAKARGAYVIGTASEAKHEFVRELGADELVDYRSVDFADVVNDIDIAFDTVGGDYALRSLQTLRKGGIVVTIVPGDGERLCAQADELGFRAKTMLVEADHAGMQSIADLIESGKLRVEIANVFPFDEAAKAHALGETNRTIGKIVFTVP